MEVSNAKRIVCRLASGLGILQALAWSLMSIIAIGIYFSQPEMESLEDVSYTQLVSQLIYNRFLFKPENENDDASLFKNMIIRSYEFQVFMWIYLVANLGWFINSCFLFFVARDGAPNRLKTKMNLWIVNTLTISLLDFIFVCLLGRDYNHCPYNPKDENGITVGVIFCYLPTGIVLTVAAKGFVLWFINLGLAYSTHFFANKIIVPKPVNNVNNGPSYPSIPRVPERRMQPPNVAPYPNPGFNQGQHNHIGQQQNLGQPNFRNNNPQNFY